MKSLMNWPTYVQVSLYLWIQSLYLRGAGYLAIATAFVLFYVDCRFTRKTSKRAAGEYPCGKHAFDDSRS
jgi:hypothetical protein